MRILLIEDDPLLGQGIVDAVEYAGDIVEWFTQGQQGLDALLNSTFDIVILDLGLPVLSGLDVLKQARAKGQILPILILTARDGISDRVTGLDNGADDYLTKPFDVGELKARLRALTRRHQPQKQAQLTHGNIVVDSSSRTVTLCDENIELSRREYNLLIEFLTHPNRVFTREFLTEKLYSWDESVESNTIEVYIHHLRKKFGRDFIKTIRGVGYRLNS